MHLGTRNNRNVLHKMLYFIVVVSQDCNNIVVSLQWAWHKFKYYDLTIQLHVSFLVSNLFSFHATNECKYWVKVAAKTVLLKCCLFQYFSSCLFLLMYKIPGQLMLYQFYPHRDVGRALRKSLAFLQLSLMLCVTLPRQKVKENICVAIVVAESSLACTHEVKAAIQDSGMFWESKSNCWYF